MRYPLTLSQQAALSKIGHMDFAGLREFLGEYKPEEDHFVRVSQLDCDHRFTKGVCYGCGMFYSQIEDSVALSNRLQEKNIDEFREAS